MIEANPRAARTVPFVSKAIGVPLAKIACRLMLGETLEQVGFDDSRAPRHVSVKEAVLRKFPSLQPNQFSTAGLGWDRPADSADPENSAKNRRVEIKVYPAEAAPAAK